MRLARDGSQGTRRAPAQVRGDIMHRRSLLWGVVAAIGGAFAASRSKAANDKAATETPATGKLKVVYHLNDLDKVNFVLGNIQNHFDGVGGPENVTLALGG